jgi:ABC-type transport system involved in multi-copper enzyme maturation permease subunit
MTAITTTRRSGPREFGEAVWTIMVKELRSRMRGRRAPMVLTAYLAVLALIAYGVYVVVAPVARDAAAIPGAGLSQANASRFVGQSIFAVLSVLQIVLVSMIAPAFTAGQISLEREKQTLDLLISTPMRPGAIIIGKLLTALAFVVLLIVAAVPITAIVLMYGGASIDDIVRQQVLLLAVATGFGAVGLFASTLMKRTQAATVLTYGAVVTLTLGSAMVFAFWAEVAEQNRTGFGLQWEERAPEQLRYLNPMVGMLDIISRVEVDGPTRFTRPIYQLFGDDLSAGAGGECIGVECDFVEPAEPGQPVEFGAFGRTDYWWPRVAVSFVGLAAVLTLLSMRLVVPAGLGWRPRRRRGTAREDDIDVVEVGP